MAYKGRVSGALTFEGREFFTKELNAAGKEASLWKLELLRIRLVRPYKIGLFFLATSLALGGLLLLKHGDIPALQMAWLKPKRAQWIGTSWRSPTRSSSITNSTNSPGRRRSPRKKSPG